MTRTKKILSALGVSAIAALGVIAVPMLLPNSVTPVAQAANSKTIVDAAKARGEVGEKADGYLGLVTGSASAEVEAAVNEINIRRKSYYTDLARGKNESVGDVAKVAAIALAKRAAPGAKLQTAEGRWITK